MQVNHYIFDRLAVRQHRNRAATFSSKHAFLHREANNQFINRRRDVKRTFTKILEIGGAFLPEQTESKDVFTVQADLSENLLLKFSKSHPVIYDEELFPFSEKTFDLVTSNLTLHWLNDIPGALHQIRNVLKPDGLFLGAMLGGDTLIELRRSLLEAEIQNSSSVSSRTSPVLDLTEAGLLMQRAGFSLPVIDTDTITVSYNDIFSLMHELRAMGETNALISRSRKFLSRKTLAAAASFYKNNYPAENGRIRATFQIIWLTGWSPHANQPKPKPRGSGQLSLSKILAK
tara:strand:+ start:33 stop:896 length:864 start_codon:yes stop_codon:yes gene_type:complete